jgi:HEPN domain-containing protein
MTGNDAQYRLKVAQGFLVEARQDVDLERWRSAVDNAQLAVENAAKAVLSLAGPVGRSHNPATQLRQVLHDKLFAAPQDDQVQRVAELAEMMGADVHIQTDYGDEVSGRTPWELFNEVDARRSVDMADEAVQLTRAIAQSVLNDSGA